MTIASCTECGKPVSTEASACPHCGAKPPQKTSKLTIVIGLLMLVGLVIAFGNGGQPAPAAAAPDPQKVLNFRQAVGTLDYVKGAMKNPKSFELVSLVRVDGPAMCVEYRGTNSFNAVVLQRHVISDTVNSSSVQAWNQNCAGKTGEDFSHARHAIK